MKTRIFIFAALLFGAVNIHAQSSIGIGTTTPNASAALELYNASSRGLIVPRMTTAQRDADIKSPKAGILIYNTTTVSFQVSTANSTWFDINTNSTSAVASGTSTNTGKVGIGTTTPDANTALDVVATSKGLLLPRGTTDPTGVAGMIYYNTATNRVKGFTTTWVNLF